MPRQAGPASLTCSKNRVIMTGQAQTHNTTKPTRAILRNLPYKKGDKLGISTQDGIVIISFADILYCEAMGNYCRIRLHEGKSVTVSKTLKHVSKFLPVSEFIRIHQSYIARFEDIITAHHEVTLSSGDKLPVSRSQRNALLTYLHNHLPIL